MLFMVAKLTFRLTIWRSFTSFAEIPIIIHAGRSQLTGLPSDDPVHCYVYYVSGLANDFYFMLFGGQKGLLARVQG